MPNVKNSHKQGDDDIYLLCEATACLEYTYNTVLNDVITENYIGDNEFCWHTLTPNPPMANFKQSIHNVVPHTLYISSVS